MRFLANLGFISQSSQFFYGIGATIRIGREMHCLPSAGFLFNLCLSDNVFGATFSVSYFMIWITGSTDSAGLDNLAEEDIYFMWNFVYANIR